MYVLLGRCRMSGDVQPNLVASLRAENHLHSMNALVTQ